MGQHRERSHNRRLTVAEGGAGVRATMKPEEEPARKISISNYQEGAVKTGNRDLIFGKRTSERPLGDVETSQVLPRRQSWWGPKGCSLPEHPPRRSCRTWLEGLGQLPPTPRSVRFLRSSRSRKDCLLASSRSYECLLVASYSFWLGKKPKGLGPPQQNSSQNQLFLT